MRSTLFDMQPNSPNVPPVWERHRSIIPALGSKGALHVHLASGMEVRHCGHPTANFPYYIVPPNKGQPILAPNGRGFQRLKLAKQHVEQLWAERSIA